MLARGSHSSNAIAREGAVCPKVAPAPTDVLVTSRPCAELTSSACFARGERSRGSVELPLALPGEPGQRWPRFQSLARLMVELWSSLSARMLITFDGGDGTQQAPSGRRVARCAVELRRSRRSVRSSSANLG